MFYWFIIAFGPGAQLACTCITTSFSRPYRVLNQLVAAWIKTAADRLNTPGITVC